MAPEMFQDQPASIQSDLYAVGVIAYELFTGNFPYKNIGAGSLLLSIVRDTPDTTMLDFDLAEVLDRLLAKTPDKRYPGADQVIQAFCQAVNQPVPEENAALRESYLQAAKFIGRENEMAQLEAALKNLTARKGSAYLIGGESGVGKSRLMDELRSRALVAGVLVVRGQAVESGGLPYQLWRDPLRRLVLGIDLNDLEASVLKPLIPDIETLLGRTISDAPELDGQAAQQRLVATIAEVFQRQKQPVALLLEDLQWTAESLIPLKYLTHLAGSLSLLIVGTYRNDESPDLPAELPEANLLKLSRLSEAEIALLSASMLGASGRQPEILNLLRQETEGNTFFMVEVVRALAEKAGRLNDIAFVTLPEQVMVGGVQQVIRRRLERIPAQMHRLLKQAAVVGRMIDLRLLNALSPSSEVDEFLTLCAESAVLEIIDGRWRFAHDKLRDAVMNDLSATEIVLFHRQVAEVIERLYPEDESQAEVLLYHWRLVDDHPKELHYTIVVARYLIHVISDYQRGLQVLERGLKLLDQVDQKKFAVDELYLLLGDAHQRQGNLEDAQRFYDQARVLGETRDEIQHQAEALVGMGWTAILQGDFGKAKTDTEAGLVLYRRIQDASGVIRGLRNLAATAYYGGDRAGALDYYTQILAYARDNNVHQDLARVLSNMGMVYMDQGDYVAATQRVQEALQMSYETGNLYSIGSCLDVLSGIAYLQGDYSTARSYALRSLAIYRQINDPINIAGQLNNLGSICEGERDYRAAHDYYLEAIGIYLDTRRPRGVSTTYINLAHVEVLLGELADGQRHLIEGLKIAQTTGVNIDVLDGIAVFAGVCLLNGQPERSAQLYGLAMNHPATSVDTQQSRLEPLHKQLEASLATDDLTLAIEQGKTLDLDVIVKEILTQDADAGGTNSGVKA
jgi:tetratricopeptide (TPR) repeat protein